MADLKNFILLFALVAFGAAASQRLIAPRIINGKPIDTLRRFPHHVSIEKEFTFEPNMGTALDNPFCGGSILNKQWILTSLRCVEQSRRLKLHFEKLYSNSSSGSYTGVVNNATVHIYPTRHDDIALVKLPFLLEFSDTIRPMSIASVPLAQLENKLAVLPGFDTNAFYNHSLSPNAPEQQLTYAMLDIASNSKCKRCFKSSPFDEYLQLCTESYSDKSNGPHITDHGSGLIIGWPAKPELVGIYSSTSYECDGSITNAYTNVAKYASWIESLIKS